METGTRTTSSNTTDHLLDIEEGIKYLNPRHNGIRFVKKLLENGRAGKDKVAESYKHEWHETSLPPRRETVTLADGSGTALTVASTAVYPIGTELRIENEIVVVTARTDATTLAIARAQLSTTGAAHSAKDAINLGYAGEEYGTGPEALSTNAAAKYNYVQTFEAAVEMSDKEIAQLSSEIGNPFSAQLERITAFFWKTFAQSVFKGVRGSTTRNSRPVHYMGGIDSFLSTNVTDVNGAMTTTVIDTLILALMNAGGTPDTLVMSPARFVKLSLLDINALMISKDEKKGGAPVYKKWQSAASEIDLDIIVDFSVLDSELYVLDSSKLAILPLVSNGINGRLALVDGTTTGASGKRRIIRGHYTLVVELEAGHAKAIRLT